MREYLDPKGANLNGTQAAIRAGYSSKGASVTAFKLLANAKIAAEIERVRSRRMQKMELTADMVISELRLLGFANMEDYIRIESDGSPRVDLSDLDRDRAAAIQEVSVEEETRGRGDNKYRVRRTKFKLSDKRGSLELLGKHLGVFENVGSTRKDRLEELMKAKLAALESKPE